MSLFDRLKSEAAAAAKSVSAAGNKSWQVVFKNLPQNVEELKALPEASLKEPHFAAALLIPALCLWPQNREEAVAMLNFLKGPKPLTAYETQFINDRLQGKEYLPFSFFQGATPENSYKPAEPYTLTVTAGPYSFDEAGYAKLYMQSGGADSPRPVQIREKPSSGEWYLWDITLLSGIRVPNSADPWA